MAYEPRPEREILARALAPGKDCPPIQRLEAALVADAAPRDLAMHLESCGYCRSELDLLRSFHAMPRDAGEAEAVRLVAERLTAPRPPAREAAPDPWWQRIFQVRWLSAAAIAVAGLMIVFAAGVQWRHRAAPSLDAPSQAEQGVLRSGALKVTAPSGDVGAVPSQIQWQPAPGAAQYQVRLLEVDHTEVWTASTPADRLDIPASVQAKIVPAKTLLLQVTAFDGSGRMRAESEFVRFRVLQNVYTR